MLSSLLLWSRRATAGAVLVLTLLPLVPSGQWWVRVWDFPRLQLLWLAAFPAAALGLHVWRARWRAEHGVWAAAIIASAGWNVAQILPFTGVWPSEVPDAADVGMPSIRILTLNVDDESERHAEVLRAVEAEDADLVLLIEVDEAWDAALRPLDARYPHRVGVVRGEGLGLVLWSRLPLAEAEVRHLVSARRPSIFATVDVPDVGPVRYIGVHPTPPGLRDRIRHNPQDEQRHDSRVRDAELVLVAREVAKDADQRWIVTGDFNDVAWSHTTRLFKDLSDLKDPRVGRRLLNTYHAQRPLWRYPIDHVFVSDGLHLIGMRRFKAAGSDHFGITAGFTFADKDDSPPTASSEEKAEAEQLVEEGTEDAAEREVSDGAEAATQSAE